MKLGDERDGAAGAPEGGLPCDLPLDDRDGGLFGSPGSAGRRRAVAVLAVVALAAVAVAAVLFVRACAAPRYGAVARAAGEGAAGVLAAAAQTGAEAQARAVAGKGPVDGVVCIDAGHGGGADLTLTPIGPGSTEMQYVEPGGTAGVATGRAESEVTLEVALLLRDKLAEAGVEVVMVREDNDTVMSSEQRAEIANAAGADIFLRLHCDGSEDPSVSGFSTLVPGANEWTAGIVDSSAYAASIMHPIIIAETGANDLGVVERTDLAGFNYCQVPSLLFEMGFMSNAEEDVKLSDPAYQEVLAQAICDATLAYLEAVSG